MIGLVKHGAIDVICGLYWSPIESSETVVKEVKEIVSRRKDEYVEEDDAKLPLLTNQYVLSSTTIGTFSAGVLPAEKGFKKAKKACSLAALCAKFSRNQRALDSLFAWQIEPDKIFLVAIKNGLPFFDAVMTKTGFDAELDFLLPSYDSGCSMFGGEGLMQSAPLSIDDLVGQAEVSEYFASAGLPADLKLLIGLVSVIAVASSIGFYVWQGKQAEKEAEEALRMAAATTVELPDKAFKVSQSALLTNIGGCKSIDKIVNAIESLQSEVKTYRVTAITASCVDGVMQAGYQSALPADLTVHRYDPRMIISETLNLASFSDKIAFEPQSIDPELLIKWQEWLIENGTQKQEIERVGLAVSFSAPTPVFSSPTPIPDGVSVVVKGDLKISGRLVFMQDATKRFKNVVWKKVTVVNKDGAFLFDITGDYYAIKD